MNQPIKRKMKLVRLKFKRELYSIGIFLTKGRINSWVMKRISVSASIITLTLALTSCKQIIQPTATCYKVAGPTPQTVATEPSCYTSVEIGTDTYDEYDLVEIEKINYELRFKDFVYTIEKREGKMFVIYGLDPQCVTAVK